MLIYHENNKISTMLKTKKLEKFRTYRVAGYVRASEHSEYFRSALEGVHIATFPSDFPLK